MAQVTVKVNGQNFTLACDDGEEAHLTALARQVDARISTIKKDVKSADDKQFMLMAGLLLADELIMANERIQELEETIAGHKGEFLDNEGEKPPRVSPALEDRLTGMLERAARRMEDIAARLR